MKHGGGTGRGARPLRIQLKPTVGENVAMQRAAEQSLSGFELIDFVMNDRLQNVDDAITDIGWAEGAARECLRSIHVQGRFPDTAHSQDRVGLLNLEVKGKRICLNAT